MDSDKVVRLAYAQMHDSCRGVPEERGIRKGVSESDRSHPTSSFCRREDDVDDDVALRALRLRPPDRMARIQIMLKIHTGAGILI